MPVILYTLFITALIPMILAICGGYFRVKQFGKLDNNHPRQQQAQLTGAGARIQAAQANAWESLGIYTATCFIAYASGLNLHTLNAVSLIFIGFRLLHAVMYMANLAWLRTTVFMGAMGCCLYIVYLSAMH